MKRKKLTRPTFFSLASLLQILPYIIVFVATLYRPYDSDLGWHLKYGEYFFEHGQVLRENIYSTMMHGFQWANTAWATDVISYAAYHILGFLGLTLLGGLVVTLTFFFFSRAFNLSFWENTLIFPLLLFFEQPINMVSFRGQLVSIMLLGVLFYLLKRYEEQKSKKIYFIIPLFLLWGNVHGQFVLGLGIFLLWILLYGVKTYLLQDKNLFFAIQEVRFLSVLFTGSILATFLHPFGIAIYKTAYLHFHNPVLQSIIEYLPLEDLSQLWWNQIIMGVLLLFGFLFLFFNDQLKQSIPYLGIVSLLYIMSFFVRRYAWSLYYLTVPFLKPLATYFQPNSKRATFLLAVVINIIVLIITVVVKSPLDQYKTMSWENYCQNYSDCSPASAEFLSKYKYKGELMTFYNWGGWLIWNYPNIKVSIDGRMHVWVDDSGYSAFQDYYAYEQNFEDIDTSKYDIVYISPQKPVYNRLNELVSEKKWKYVYKDDRAAIFERVKK